jgi:hypothetical protein
MNLPKDWSKKPDWLDKAKEPSDGGKIATWGVVIIVLAVCSVCLLVAGLFF